MRPIFNQLHGCSMHVQQSLTNGLPSHFGHYLHSACRCAKAHPLTTAILTSGIKTSVADLFAQKVRCAVI